MVMAKTIEYNTLDDLGIYKGLNFSKGDVYITEWFYVTKEVIKFLLYKVPVMTFAVEVEVFANILDITRQTVRNGIPTNRYLHLRDWYYNKTKLLEYLIKKI